MINQVLTFIDDIKKAQIEVAKKLNENVEGYDSFWCLYDSHDYSEHGYEEVDKDLIYSVMNEDGFGVSKYNYDLDTPLLYTIPIHVNGGKKIYTAVILFPTWNEYMKQQLTEEEILEKSIVTKPLYKKDNIEVGLTIENELREPTDTCWGYTFGPMRYYIIKDGKKTITDSRATIRKIFNGKPLETTNNIKIDWNVYTDKNEWGERIETSFEVFDFMEVYKGESGSVYQIEICGNKTYSHNGEYYVGNEKALYDMYVNNIEDEILISMLGGTDEIVKRYLDGGNFDKESFICFNYKIEDLLDIEEDMYEPYIKYASFNFKELEDLRIWKLL